MSRNNLVGCSCGRVFGDYRTQEKHSLAISLREGSKEGKESHKRVYLGRSGQAKRIVSDAPQILSDEAFTYFKTDDEV